VVTAETMKTSMSFKVIEV